MKKENPKKINPKKAPLKKSSASAKNFDLIGLVVIVLLGIIIYSNSFDCAFQLDDKSSIIGNVKIQNVSDINTLWHYSSSRFIPYYSFAVNYHFAKLDVWGYHFFNLMVHLINSSLVWWLTLLIFSSPSLKNYSITKHKHGIALITGLLFVSHPLATESVTYIVQRIASMAALFYFLSVALYLKGRLIDKNKYIKYFLFAGSFLSAWAALLTKENTYTLPFAILLVELCFLRTKKISINFKDYRVVVILLVFVGFIGFILTKFSYSIFRTLPADEYSDFKAITSLNYLYTQFSVIVKYIQLLLVPVNLNLDYDYQLSNSIFEMRTLLDFVVLSSLLILAIVIYKKNRIISFGILWFFLTLSVESSIIPISDLIFEHRTYLPSFGFFLILSSVVYLLFWEKKRNIAITIFVIIIVSNSFLTFERNKDWKDKFTLWNDVILKSPKKARAYFGRGYAYEQEGKTSDAVKDYDKTIELNPKYPEAYINRGKIYLKEKKYEAAIADFDTAAKLKPKFADTYNSRGNVYKEEQKYDLALADYNKTLALNPNFFEVYNNIASVEILLKKFDDAIVNLNKTIEINPNLGIAYANRGIAELNIGKKEDACKDLQKALDLGFKQVSDLYKQNCH